MQYNGPMKLQRQHLVIRSLRDMPTDGFVQTSATERVKLVWELTREVCSLSPKHDAEQRLQRHIVRIARAGS